MTQIGQNMNATEISHFKKKMLTILQPFLLIFGGFHHSDCSANHKKLNIIQK